MAKELPKITVKTGCFIDGARTDLSFPCLYQAAGGDEWVQFDSVEQLATELWPIADAGGFRDMNELRAYIKTVFTPLPKNKIAVKGKYSQALDEGFFIG